MKKISRRSFLTAAAACGAAAALTCGGSSASSTAASSAASSTAASAAAGPVTLQWSVWDKESTPYWQAMADGYMASHKDVTIEMVDLGSSDYMTVLATQLAGSADLDVVTVKDIPGYANLINLDYLKPLNEVLTRDTGDFNGTIEQLTTDDGNFYAVPFRSDFWVLYYNKDLFTQAGLDPNAPPTTYDEMLEMAGKLAELKTADGNKVYPFGQTTASVAVSGSSINAMVYNFGGTVLAPDGTLSIDNQGFKDAITMLQELDKKGYNPQNSKLKDLRQLFATGQLAMYYDQSWGFNGVQSINPEAKNFAATAKPLKGGSGNGASMLQAHILAYMDNGENQKTAARLFTEYLVTADQLQDYMTNITPAYPATKSMESMALNPVLEGAAGAIENLTTTPFIPTLGDLNLELCTLAQDVTVGGTDVDKAIESFRTAASNIIG